MGTEALIGGLFGLGSAAISAASTAHAQSAQASAQADLNAETMAFNRSEAKKARDFTASQAVIDRKYNSAEALAARSFTAAQAKQMMDFSAGESSLARNFNAAEAQKARSFDAQQSLLARQFEERLSSTAHQREVQDLRKAGLNPILSATGGNGASTPVAPIIGSPMASSPMASGVLGSSAQASHSGSGSVAASVGAMQALKKGNFLGNFMSSALDLVKANAEFKKAEASDKEADAALKNASTNALNGIQSRIESNARVLNLNENTQLAKLKQVTEKELANKAFEEAKKIVQDKLNGERLTEATIQKLRSDAGAYAAAMYSQAGLNSTRAAIESAKSPHEIKVLEKEADVKQQVIDRYKFDMSDPESLARREYYSSDGKLKVGFKEVFGASAFTASVIKAIK